MSDIINERQKEISTILTPYANEMEDPRLGEFLALSIGRILFKKEIEVYENDLRHITDWLKVAIINNDAWISNLDSSGRPKKLMKFADIKGIVKEADKAMLIHNQKLSAVQLISGDEELIAELDDGYSIVKLLTPVALDRESSQMHHCIGNGGYDTALSNPYRSFLSLRDHHNNAHVTIEIDDDTIVQLQGKQNKQPVRKYRDIILKFIKDKKYCAPSSVSGALGCIIDKNDNWYDVENLPENLTFEGNISIYQNDEFNIVFPKGLTVVGDVRIINCRHITLSEGLIVHGSLNLSKSDITELPQNITVDKDLLLSYTEIEHLSNNIKLNGNLYLDCCLHLKSITGNLHVGGHLVLLETDQLKILPENLFVGKDLNLCNSGLEKIPEGTVVNGKLDISSTRIKSLPKSLHSLRGLSASHSDLEDISNLKHIGAILDISSTKVKSIPDDLVVGWSIVAKLTSLEKIGENVSVRKNLDISHTELIELPSSLSVGTLTAKHSRLRNLPDNLHIKGDLDLSNNPNIYTLPKNMQVDQILTISSTNITELPEDLKASTVVMDSDQIVHIPEKLLSENIILEINHMGIISEIAGTKISIQEYAKYLENNIHTKNVRLG